MLIMKKVGELLLIRMERHDSDEEIILEIIEILEQVEKLMITSGIILYDKEVEVYGKFILMELLRIKLMFELQEV
jgi:hypothetical protein